MKTTRWWIRSLLVVAVLGLSPAIALAAGCGSPPDGSGNWMFMDDVALNMRRVGQSSVFQGAYSTVGSAVNYDAEPSLGEKLSWTLSHSASYSASLKAWDGSSNTSHKKTLQVVFDLPAMHEARLLVRPMAQYDYYEFDAGCVWFNTSTHRTTTAVADYGVSGSVRRTWNESTLKFRSVW